MSEARTLNLLIRSLLVAMSIACTGVNSAYIVAKITVIQYIVSIISISCFSICTRFAHETGEATLVSQLDFFYLPFSFRDYHLNKL